MRQGFHCLSAYKRDEREPPLADAKILLSIAIPSQGLKILVLTSFSRFITYPRQIGFKMQSVCKNAYNNYYLVIGYKIINCWQYYTDIGSSHTHQIQNVCPTIFDLLLFAQFEKLQVFSRGIEWSLWAFANMQTVHLFLQARGVIKFVLRAVSTLENRESE